MLLFFIEALENTATKLSYATCTENFRVKAVPELSLQVSLPPLAPIHHLIRQAAPQNCTTISFILRGRYNPKAGVLPDGRAKGYRARVLVETDRAYSVKRFRRNDHGRVQHLCLSCLALETMQLKVCDERV